MSKTYALLCNATTARFYNLSSTQPTLVQQLNHAEGRMKGSDLVSDGPGHYKAEGLAGSDFDSKNNPHQVELAHFAIEISRFLEHEHNQNTYAHLFISAEPHFYGILEKHLSKQVLKVLKKSPHHDYIPLATLELEKVLLKLQKEAMSA